MVRFMRCCHSERSRGCNAAAGGGEGPDFPSRGLALTSRRGMSRLLLDMTIERRRAFSCQRTVSLYILNSGVASISVEFCRRYSANSGYDCSHEKVFLVKTKCVVPRPRSMHRTVSVFSLPDLHREVAPQMIHKMVGHRRRQELGS